MTYPPTNNLSRVDWVDYRERVRDAEEPEAFARQVLARAGAHDVWLVWAPGYKPFTGECNDIRLELQAQREGTDTVVPFRPRIFEHPSLVRSPAS